MSNPEAGTSVAPQPAPEDFAQMFKLIGGFQFSQAVYVVAKLGIATALANGPLPLHVLAKETGANTDALRRLVRSLAPVGLFHSLGEDVVTVTPLGMTLVDGTPAVGLALFYMEQMYAPFGELLHAVRTGESGGTRYLGKPFFGWVAEDPYRVRVMKNAMGAAVAFLRAGIFDGYDLPGKGTIADIGGADGTLLVSRS